MDPRWRIERRTFLRGAGAAVALPLLEAMAPAAEAAAAPPTRAAFLYVPNGVHMPDWRPSESGPLADLPPILAPLKPHREKLLVLSGLAHDKANANGDGAGDHARSAATFLTGCQAKKTGGRDIHLGISVDQIAAAEIGGRTEFPSLELGCERGRSSGNCDSGYSCAYSSNISWRTASSPMAKEVNPRAVFDRLLFRRREGESEAELARRIDRRKSLLDLVQEDARQLQRRLGQTDRRKLDEYLASLRALEQRIRKADRDAESEEDHHGAISRPEGIPADFGKHLRLMGDLMALAFQLDKTRIATFMLANAGSNRSYPQVEVREGHHSLSHHRGKAEKQQKIARINRFHVAQLAYLLKRLDSISEGEGTLLDHSMILYGSAISDGNRHRHDDLPVLLAGGGGGTLASGRHIECRPGTPLTNLFLALLGRLGVKARQVGDSTGVLEGLEA